MDKDIYILGIESSCDETAAAVVRNGRELLGSAVASQIDIHRRFGGVVPEIAGRNHLLAIMPTIDEALTRAGVAKERIDAVAVTYGAGLIGCLLVGVSAAKALAYALGRPLVKVNHIEGHIAANFIAFPELEPPFLALVASGGHTSIISVEDYTTFVPVAATSDDAVGEAFDKVAKALGLGYPGGPVISREAAKGDPNAIPFPRAMMHSGDLRFSLSGLKTAVVTYINNERAAGRELNVPNICASFQQAVVDVQVKKAEMALEQTGARTFCLGGGVAANPALRDAYEQLCERLHVRLTLPPLSACGDNAGMIALVALDRHNQGKFFTLEADAQAHANLDEPY